MRNFITVIKLSVLILNINHFIFKISFRLDNIIHFMKNIFSAEKAEQYYKI